MKRKQDTTVREEIRREDDCRNSLNPPLADCQVEQDQLALINAAFQ
jgi:hypothetical protein